MSGVDWLAFRPAILAFLQGANPYTVGSGWARVFEPFWVYALLAPLAILPFQIGRGVLFIISLIAFCYTAVRLKARRWQVVLFLLSFPVMGCLMTGNIDWLVLLGLWMPPALGLFFVLIKPQIGIGIAIFWAVEAYRIGGVDEVVRRFAPVICAFLISFMLYGFWPLQLAGMDANPERVTGFPWVVPLGVYILYSAVRQRDTGPATASAPLLAPYASQFNHSAVLVGLFQRPRAFVAAWVVLWSYVLVRFAM